MSSYTSTRGLKRSAQFTPDSKEVYYLDRGRVFNVTLEKREPKAIEAFHQAWSYLRDQFFEEKMNGVDWRAVRTIYQPRVAGARTPDEMRRIVSMMLGEYVAKASAGRLGASRSSTGRSCACPAQEFSRATARRWRCIRGRWTFR
jgi:hypothetical protein